MVSYLTDNYLFDGRLLFRSHAIMYLGNEAERSTSREEGKMGQAVFFGGLSSLVAILVIGALLGVLIGDPCNPYFWDPPDTRTAKIQCLEQRSRLAEVNQQVAIERGWVTLYTVLSVGFGLAIAGAACLIFRFGYPVWVDGQVRRREAEARAAAVLHAERVKLLQAQTAFVRQFPSPEQAIEFVQAVNGHHHLDDLGKEVSRVSLKVA